MNSHAAKPCGATPNSAAEADQDKVSSQETETRSAEQGTGFSTKSRRYDAI